MKYVQAARSHFIDRKVMSETLRYINILPMVLRIFHQGHCCIRIQQTTSGKKSFICF